MVAFTKRELIRVNSTKSRISRLKTILKAWLVPPDIVRKYYIVQYICLLALDLYTQIHTVRQWRVEKDDGHTIKYSWSIQCLQAL